MDQIRISRILLIFVSTIMICACHTGKHATSIFSDEIQLIKLSKHTYLHRSFLKLDDGTRVECNGMVVIDHGHALVFDTPSEESSAISLIRYLKGNLGVKIVGVVVNHFHDDCVGGLSAFHHDDIPSYGHILTISLAQEHGNQVPKIGFNNEISISVGNTRVECKYFGPAHTHDNIVAWFPDDKVLFGGCMVKSMNATKGNMTDSDLDAWPKTTTRIREAYPNVETIILSREPSHADRSDPSRSRKHGQASIRTSTRTQLRHRLLAHRPPDRGSAVVSLVLALFVWNAKSPD